jgi:hypothetical protein
VTTQLSVFSLIVSQTKDEIFNAALRIAELVGLPTSTWRAGDPTRTLFRAMAETTEARDLVAAELAKSAFLEHAEGDWLTLRAEDVYGVTRETETFAAATVTIDNTGGGVYEIEPGGLIFSNSETGMTYQNQSTVSIAALTSDISVSVVAQTAGSAGSAAEDEIDTIVSPTLIGVEVTASTAAIGTDAQSDVGLREQCLATLGALSPNGPADAYEYVARNSELTGVQGVTRARSDGDNATGDVTLYVATTTAALDAGSVSAIQDAVDLWATPLCTNCTVTGATPQTQAVTLTGVPSSAQTIVEAALTAYYASVDLGGTLARSAIASAVHVACAAEGITVTSVGVTSPASDVVLAANRFPVLGTVTL